ncbi:MULTISPECIES: type VI secretion system-associated protein TagF [unclassified Brenneria]|uniref:type VI secretion system-associated protein TagF n=1 Tax=unclassified Brenneria TaxID=2634434 RepID=UPI0018F06331|nr:type VI secretion system-associated protein TagF [Brenneria sp. L3-3C-1]MBJ7223519.1 type VI secretion system-associated protein TagF [Brenneria sp. L3-3C-1]MEE3644760.1 type VI secretion system-associated protein TagF [Brenneria sp. L3_3C_1]
MIGCFGKLPADADFVSLHGAVEEVREFDAWLQAAIGGLQHEEDWRERFDRLPLSFYCYRARTGNWLFAGLVSSRDASGRRYPFMVFQCVHRGLVEGFVSPHTLFETFAGQLAPMLNQARSGADAGALIERIAALRPWGEQDLHLYRRVHDKFLQDFNLLDIASALQHAYPEFVSRASLHRLAGLAQQLRAGVKPVARLPLPAERGLKRPVADLWCTWLASLVPASTIPEVSVLVDDFMRPSLLCLSRSSDAAYRVLAGCDRKRECYDLLGSFDVFDEQRRELAFPDADLPLGDFIERFSLSLTAASLP